MTEELLKKKAIKSERRREVAAQKREKEKVWYDNYFLDLSKSQIAFPLAEKNNWSPSPKERKQTEQILCPKYIRFHVVSCRFRFQSHIVLHMEANVWRGHHLQCTYRNWIPFGASVCQVIWFLNRI